MVATNQQHTLRHIVMLKRGYLLAQLTLLWRSPIRTCFSASMRWQTWCWARMPQMLVSLLMVDYYTKQCLWLACLYKM